MKSMHPGSVRAYKLGCCCARTCIAQMILRRFFSLEQKWALNQCPFKQRNGAPVKTIGIFLSLLLALTMLQGCGGGSTSSSSVTTSTVRLVNATSASATLDLTLSGAMLASGVATGSASGYATISSGISTFMLDRGGSGTPSAQTTLSLSSGVDYSLVAYTRGQQLQVTAFTDDEPAPASGNGKIRVANLSLDAGSVDVYVTAAGGNLSNASALTTNLAGATGYFVIAKGTYHIWVTGAGNIADLRLDIPSVVISDQQVLTLILTSTTGGALVDGWLVTQQGAVSAQQNASARVRIAANIAANGSIAAAANGVPLSSSTLISPVVGSYALVPAGTLAMSVAVNGNTVNVGNLNAAAGADLTLLAVGNGASPQFLLLSDDNTLPLSGMAKLRLVNGVNGLADNISLSADYNLIAQNVAPGTVSAAASVNGGTISLLQVNSSNANTSLYVATNVSLQSPGVYSVFILGNNTAPVGILRRDR